MKRNKEYSEDNGPEVNSFMLGGLVRLWVCKQGPPIKVADRKWEVYLDGIQRRGLSESDGTPIYFETAEKAMNRAVSFARSVLDSCMNDVPSMDPQLRKTTEGK
jgi:hypothetical protein